MENITTTSTLADSTGGLLSGEGSIQVIGNVSYPTIPPKRFMSIEQAFAEKERKDAELRKNPPAKNMTATQEELLATAINAVNTSKTDTTTQLSVQTLSAYDARLGQIPEGYVLSVSCATCEYFCGGLSERGTCAKYDFPCTSYYVCSAYEKGGSYALEDYSFWDESISAYAIPINISNATNEQLLLLSDAAETNPSVLDIDKGIVYVKDEPSAKLVLQNMSILADVNQQVVLSILSKYNLGKTRTPSKPLLFKLAESKPGSAYTNYEQLYASKYGNVTGCYVEVVEDSPKLDLVKLAQEYPTLHKIAVDRSEKQDNAKSVDELFEDILRQRNKI